MEVFEDNPIGGKTVDIRSGMVQSGMPHEARRPSIMAVSLNNQNIRFVSIFHTAPEAPRPRTTVGTPFFASLACLIHEPSLPQAATRQAAAVAFYRKAMTRGWMR